MLWDKEVPAELRSQDPTCLNVEFNLCLYFAVHCYRQGQEHKVIPLCGRNGNYTETLSIYQYNSHSAGTVLNAVYQYNSHCAGTVLNAVYQYNSHGAGTVLSTLCESVQFTWCRNCT